MGTCDQAGCTGRRRRPSGRGCSLLDAPASFDDPGRNVRTGNERGAVLPLLALILVVLMGVVGFAVDLGWLYWNSIEIQHGADAAALGGVIYIASDADKAKVEGRAAAAENGYIDATLGGP